MPCYDPGPSDGEKKISELTNLLCFACRYIQTYDPKAFFLNPDLNDWWQKHKKEDSEMGR